MGEERNNPTGLAIITYMTRLYALALFVFLAARVFAQDNDKQLGFGLGYDYHGIKSEIIGVD